MQHLQINDTFYAWFGANDTSGSGNDGASAVYDVRLGGGAAGDAPILSGSATLLTHANYPAGCYEIAFVVSVANGFAADASYGVFSTLAVDSQNPTGLVGAFRTAPVPANQIQLGGSAQSSTDLKDFADTGYDPATHKVQGVVLTDTVTTYTGNTLQTANVATLITTVGAAGAGLTDLGGMSTTMKGQVQTEANDAIVANNLDHLLAVAAVAGDAVDSSIIARLASKSATPSFASFTNTTDSLEAIRDNMGTAQTGDAYAIVNSGTFGNSALNTKITNTPGLVWEELTASHVTASTFGLMVNNINSAITATGIFVDQLHDAIVATDSTVVDVTPTAAAFDTGLTEANNFWNDALLVFTSGALQGQSKPITTYAQANGAVTFDEPFTSAPANGDSFSIQVSHIHPITQVADAVWDEQRAGHVAAGSFGEGVASVQGNVTGNVAGSTGSVVGAVGSVAGNVGGNVVGSVGSVVGSVGSVAGNVGGNVVGSVGSVAGAVGSVTGNVGGNVAGSVGSVASAVSIDQTAAVATSNTANTIGDCLNAARAQGFGKWAISGTTLTLYAPDGTTAVRTFTLDSATTPTSRT